MRKLGKWHGKIKWTGRRLFWLLGFALLGAVVSPRAFASPQIPGAAPGRPIALVGGTIHKVGGPAITGGTLVFEKGRVTAVGRRVKVPAKAKRIELRGRHVYPGLINAYGQLGLVEISAVRATVDYRETGRLNPNVKAEVAFNPDSELIPVTRSGGVLVALSAPTGGIISGTSALMQLDGWSWEEMTVKAPVGMHVRWPRMPAPLAWPAKPPGGSGDPLEPLERCLADARAYQKAREAAADEHPVDLRWEALLPVLAGQLPLIVAADRVGQIQTAVAFAQCHGVKLILLGGYDAPLCADLQRREVPVIVRSTHRLPLRRDDLYDAAYTLPQRLRAAGVPFCIASRNTYNARNLAFEAAMAAAYGLPRQEALKAITLYPARILGSPTARGAWRRARTPRCL
ncbi:MAG TPA: imidazolonepropionase [Planctomycetaceae bacterium]|nr:imidazolonepropionase [Planctomycetaceae bacterium]